MSLHSPPRRSVAVNNLVTRLSDFHMKLPTSKNSTQGFLGCFIMIRSHLFFLNEIVRSSKHKTVFDVLLRCRGHGKTGKTQWAKVL